MLPLFGLARCGFTAATRGVSKKAGVLPRMNSYRDDDSDNAWMAMLRCYLHFLYYPHHVCLPPTTINIQLTSTLAPHPDHHTLTTNTIPHSRHQHYQLHDPRHQHSPDSPLPPALSIALTTITLILTTSTPPTHPHHQHHPSSSQLTRPRLTLNPHH